MYLGELSQNRFLRQDHVVRENQPEMGIVQTGLSAENRVSETQRFRLPHIGEICDLGNPDEVIPEFALSSLFQQLLQFDRAVEIVLDGAFAPPG